MVLGRLMHLLASIGLIFVNVVFCSVAPMLFDSPNAGGTLTYLLVLAPIISITQILTTIADNNWFNLLITITYIPTFLLLIQLFQGGKFSGDSCDLYSI